MRVASKASSERRKKRRSSIRIEPKVRSASTPEKGGFFPIMNIWDRISSVWLCEVEWLSVAQQLLKLQDRKHACSDNESTLTFGEVGVSNLIRLSLPHFLASRLRIYLIDQKRLFPLMMKASPIPRRR